MNMGFYIKFHPNQQLNEKPKTTNNGSFLKLFKTLTARVLSSPKLLGLRPRIFKLDKTVRVLNIIQKLISNSRGKHKANQYHDGDFIPDKTY